MQNPLATPETMTKHIMFTYFADDIADDHK
jgi:hypothetical protein